MSERAGDVPDPGVTIRRRDVRRHHERWADAYDARAVLATRTREELLARLELLRLTPAVVLDAGAGTGAGALALARRYPAARVLALDHARAMCRRARRRRTWWTRYDVLQGDVAALPLREASVDLLFSNLALQDAHPVDGVLAEARRVLADGGVFFFATLGPDTLRELRESCAAVDDHPHVHPFVDMHDLGEALMRAGLREPVLDVEHYVLTYPDWGRLVRELRELGGASALAARRGTLTGPGRLAALATAYEAHRRDGVLPLTFEVVFGHAWRAGAAAAGAPADGEVRISLNDIRRPGAR